MKKSDQPDRPTIAEMNWRERLHFVPRFSGYPIRSMLVLVGFTLVVMLTESAGIAMIFPLIEILQRGGIAPNPAEMSQFYQYLSALFQLVNLELTVASLIVVTGCVIAVRQAIHYVFMIVQAVYTNRAIETVSSETYQALLSTNVSYSENFRSGTIINALFTESKRAATLAAALIGIVGGAIKIVVLMALLAFISWKATVVAAIALFLVVGLVSWHYLSGSRDAGRVVNKMQDSLTRYVADRLGLVRLIKTYGSEQTESESFARENRMLCEGRVSVARHAAGAKVTIESIAAIGSLALLYIAVLGLDLDLAVLGVFLIVTFRLLPVAQEIAMNRQSIAACTDSLLYIDKLRHQAEVAAEVFDCGQNFPVFTDAIRFENVSFSYPAGDETSTPVPALYDINLVIPAGKTTALLGPSGAGKSTLIDLIPRLRTPSVGSILFDDVSAEDIRLSGLRAAVAMVSQDTLIIDGTVMDNLCYGNPGATREEIVAAATAAFADAFIRELPKGYDTIVGERGVLLSGGQKQRLALARALLAKVPILLLDEPTSALDSDSERAVQRALERLQASNDTTIIIIAHRLSTVRHADQIVVLEGGRLLGTGTHDTLMESAPWYRKIVELQTGERVADIDAHVGPSAHNAD